MASILTILSKGKSFMIAELIADVIIDSMIIFLSYTLRANAMNRCVKMGKGLW